ncbi:MAG: energy transducer TonB [Verrucomicrobia bacterium]|nr:energy transducer TonB [Verrucomicrobiota bacterium]
MKKLHTVTLPKQDDARRSQTKRRPATALVTSVIFHTLLIGILVLIPYTIKSQRNSPVPPQFTLHYSNAEDLLAEIPDPQPVEEIIVSRQTLTNVAQLIPKIVISHLSPSLPIVTISASFVQSERADSIVETSSPSLDFPKPPTETAKKSAKRSSSPPSHSSGLIAARPMKRRAPIYPTLARKKGYEGTSVFIATINPDGTIKDLQLSQTSGHPILDKAAKEALRHWKFTPAKRNGSTVASQLRIPVVFRLG